MLTVLSYLYVTGTPFSQELIYRFQQRREKIMENYAMKNAMFCDPRHCFELTSEERSCAKQRLVALYNRLQSNQFIFFTK